MCFPYGKCLDKIESFVEKTFTLLQNSRPRCHKQRSLSRTQKCRKIQQGRRANTLLHCTNTNLSVHELLLASPTFAKIYMARIENHILRQSCTEPIEPLFWKRYIDD